MSYKDYYETLEVARTASQDEIAKSFRKLARKFHPDVNHQPGAEDRFKQLNEAYDTLKDPERRKLYDRYGAAWKAISEGRQPPPGAENARFDFRDFGFGGAGGGASGFEGRDIGSIFEQFFGGRPTDGRSSRPRSRAPRRGEDHVAPLEITVEDAFHGGSREIGVRDESGQTTRLQVRIPGGVRSGQKIRLAGKGGAGAQGGLPGDLLLEVQFLPDGRFRLEGDDVHTVLQVSPWEAALGATVTLQTLEGEVRLKVPPCSSSGRSIRLKERGYPRKEAGRGDLFATVQVVLPDALSERERELFEQLQQASTFHPRG